MKSTALHTLLGVAAGLMLVAGVASADPVAVHEDVPEAKIVRKAAGLDAVLAPDAKVERVAKGFDFTEGPMWFKGALWFSDLVGNRMYSLSEDGKLRFLIDHAGGLVTFPKGGYGGSNAMVANKDGTVLMNQHGMRRIVQIDEQWGIKVFLDKYQDKPLNSPNDLVYTADGALYFSDPPYGLFDPGNPNKDLDKDPAHAQKFNGVYRYKDGKLTAVITDLPRPNGVALSPDGKSLYVANSENPAAVYRYDIKADGNVGSRKLVADFSKEKGAGVPDGMKVDSLGNLWTSGPGGFHVYSPKGELLGQIEFPEVASNLAWGPDGMTAYFTGSTSIYKLPLKIAGQQPVYFFK
jgi:gluconolactonase